MMRLREKALGGDLRAMALFISLAQQSAADKEAAGSERLLSAAEEDILQRYVEDMQKPASNEGPDKEEPEDG